MSYNFLQLLRYSTLLEWDVKRYFPENISTFYKLRSLSACLQLEKRPVELQDDQCYKRVKIRLYGKGISLRDVRKGCEIKTKEQYLAREGQLICSRIDARHGAFAIVPEELDEAIISSSFVVFNIDEKLIDPLYLLLICRSSFFRAICEQKSSGTTGRRMISGSLLVNISIPLPPLVDQKQMVAAYSSKQEKVRFLKEKKTKLEESIQPLLADSLGIELLQRNEEHSDKLLQFFDYAALLDKWTVGQFSLRIRTAYYPLRSIQEVCQVKSGTTPIRSRKEYYENGDIVWIKTGELKDNILYDSAEKITREAFQDNFDRCYPVNSLLIALFGTNIGKTAKLGVPAVSNQACAALFGFDKCIVVDFLWIYLQAQTKYLKKMAYGSAQPNINLAIIRNYPIPIPPISKQKKIVSAIKKIKSEIKNIEEEVKCEELSAENDFRNAIFGKGY